MPIEQAKAQDWEMGNRFPTAAQNLYFKLSAFAYPDSYTAGSLGARVLQAPAILWMQCFATKSWMVREKYRFSLRLDGHNLTWKHPNRVAPNSTYNLNNASSWGRFTGVLGDFSLTSAPSDPVITLIGVFSHNVPSFTLDKRK